MEQIIQIHLSTDDLKQIIREAIAETSTLVPSEPTTQEYMTKKELAAFARMSPGLVNRLANEGKFIRHRIGGRVLYSRAQVLDAIKSGSAIKYAKK